MVDLSDVDFMPSMAIGVLVGALKRSEGRIQLVAAEQTIARQLLKICGLPCADPDRGRSQPA